MSYVFNFTLFDIISGENKLSPRMATAPVIRRLKGEIAWPEAGIEIDSSRLDGNGMICRTLISATD